MTAGLIFGPKEGFGIYNRHIKGKCLKKILYRMIQGNLARVSDVACGSLVYLLLYITVNIFYNILYSYLIFFIYLKLINFQKFLKSAAFLRKTQILTIFVPFDTCVGHISCENKSTIPLTDVSIGVEEKSNTICFSSKCCT